MEKISFGNLANIGVEIAADLASRAHREIRRQGGEREEARAISEGAALAYASFLARIEERIHKPRGFICDEKLLPTRATHGSAGYDFVAPNDVVIPFASTVKVKLGLRCICFPMRS